MNETFQPLFGVGEHDIARAPEEEAALLRLSVFAGSFDVHDAAAVLQLPYEETFGVLTLLTQQALIEYNPLVERYSLFSSTNIISRHVSLSL